jgi:hypothetical protein
MRGRGNARDELVAALEARGGAGTEIHAGPSRNWASVTFTGARHRLEIRLPTCALAMFEDGLEEAEFALRGHLLADIAIADSRTEGDTTVLGIEALTIEES